ncbi:hypothetical protein [Streptomyces sp. Tu 3180]|uniref:hypothetical protein n=1 Tax=Streptomyces sp. Tu 3180 TaxID=2682611 RepID=UPI00135BDB28|nr:hypothetical protein [Streptomyces sp. Tu 3180]KAF3468528.1 hypothetical protein GL259_32450 [Streptomyces sp. Tu 3180]
MTASAPLPPPPSHPPTPATGRRAPSRWIVPCVAAVVAAGAGMGIGWLLWSGPDSAASGTGVNNAAADAVGACQAWKRVPSLGSIYDNDDKDDRMAHYERAVGAATLAQSAARLDNRYDALGKAFQNVSVRLQTYDMRGAEAEAAHEKVTTLCAELDD